MPYFEDRDKAAKKRAASRIQQEKRQGSLGPNVPTLEEDPEEPDPGSQWIVPGEENENPQFKAVVGDETYHAELVPEGGGQYVLLGESRMYLSAVDPPGGLWMVENGRLLEIVDYPEFYALVGDAFNTGGETSAQFRLPDQRNRTPIGAGSTYALGARGGAATHQLIEAEMAVHNHSTSSTLNIANAGGHSHEIPGNDDYVVNQEFTSGRVAASGNNWQVIDHWGNVHQPVTDTAPNHDHAITGSVSVQNAGSGQAHNNLPPYLAKYFICRVKP